MKHVRREGPVELLFNHEEVQAMMRHVSVLVLVGVLLAAGPVAERSDIEAAGYCTTVQSSGAGETLFATCITDTGNVRMFESPAGVDSFEATNSGDSYAICDRESGGNVYARAWSRWGTAESNFSYPTTHSATGNVRKTADGRYTLTQSFVRDATEQQLIVTMTLRNNGPGPVTDVTIQRIADINAGGTTNFDRFLRSTESIAALDVNPTNGGNGKGMIMSAATPELNHGTTISSYSDYMASAGSCNHPYWHNNAPPGDYVGIIEFYFGELAAGKAKTAKIVYRRF